MSGAVEVDAEKAEALACTQVERGGVVLLSFGKQVEGGTRSFKDATTLFTYDHIREVARAYAGGLSRCRGGEWTLAVATSNYKLSDPDLARERGSEWQKMLQAARDEAPAGVEIVGGIDLEPGWGPVGAARAWLDAYHQGTVPLVVNASADGCPTRGLGGKCANGWEVEDLAALVWENPRSTALPQIYRTDLAMAHQWGVLARTWTKKGGVPRFSGIMTQQRACRQVKPELCHQLDLGAQIALEALGKLLPVHVAPTSSTDIGWG